MSLEKAHWKLSAYPAQVAGMRDRGHLTEGFGADIVIYDLDELDYGPVERLKDFPAGEWRLDKRPKGYKYIIVNGVVTYTDNSSGTGGTTGRLRRNGICSARPGKITR